MKKRNGKKILLSDERLKNAKVFKEFISFPIAVSENGFIGVSDIKTRKPKIIHIKDVNGFEIVVDGKNVANVGGAVVGGLLFGGVGAIIGGGTKQEKITKMNLLLKINDFNNPTIEMPLIVSSMKKGSLVYDATQKEIQELMATLELIEKTTKK
jgi:hypothetical protein